jgi:hypothetical protein
MKFSMSIAAFVAMASSVLAQETTPDFDSVYTPENNEVVHAGQVFDITWSAPEKYADQTVSIELIGGATQGSQQVLQTIAAGIPNTDEQYQWTVDATLGAHAVYGLKVILDSDPSVFQYSMPFQIEGDAEVVTVDTSGLPVTVTSAFGTMTVTLSSAEATTTSEVESTTTSEVESTTTSEAETTSSVASSTITSAFSTTLSTSTRIENSTSVVTSTTVVAQTSTTVAAPSTSTTGAAEEGEEENNEGAPSAAAGLSAPLALAVAFAMAFFAL